MHCQNDDSEQVNHISARDVIEHVEPIDWSCVDNKFCGRYPQDMRCWVYYLDTQYSTYSCKSKSSAELVCTPAVLVNHPGTRNGLSALDKKSVWMDICFLNGVTCTNMQDCWYDPMRRKQHYCMDRPSTKFEGSPVAPVDDPSAADTYTIYCR